MIASALVNVDCFAGSVKAVVTTRHGGFSQGCYGGLNLGTHVGDDRSVVEQNRMVLRTQLGLKEDPVWLNQIHGSQVAEIQAKRTSASATLDVDATFTRIPDVALCVMAADCLPILIASTNGEVIAAVHAGWRGLAAGIIKNTLDRLPAGYDYAAYIGPAIGVCHYEVDARVLEAFSDNRSFVQTLTSGHWMFNLSLEAEYQLREAGVTRVTSANTCTWCDERFYSFRRDGETGRFAALIWKSANN